MASEPSGEVAYDDTPQGPEDHFERENVEEGNPEDSGLPLLEQLKMSEEEQRDYDQFSLASVSRCTSKRPWKAQGDSKDSESQGQDDYSIGQARPQAVAKAQSVKSTNSDQRSVQLRSVQDQPARQAHFPVIVPQGQGHRLGRPIVVRHNDFNSLLNEDEISIDLDNEAVLKEKQARSEILDKVAEFCNLNRQDTRLQKEILGMRLPAYNAPTKKSLEISMPWLSSTVPIIDRNHDIVKGKLNKSLKPQNPNKPWGPKDFFGGSGYYTHNTRGYFAKPDTLEVPSRPPLLNALRRINLSFMYPGILKILVLE